jgi:hypothetical protein
MCWVGAGFFYPHSWNEMVSRFLNQSHVIIAEPSSGGAIMIKDKDIILKKKNIKKQNKPSRLYIVRCFASRLARPLGW